jgi:hypothetical protein
MPKTKPITKAKARAIAKAKAQQKEKRQKLIITGAIGLVVIILLVLFLTWPEAPVKKAEWFLALLGENKLSDAYQSTSRTFQEHTNEEEFKTSVEERGFLQYDSVAWLKPKKGQDQATLEGTITTKSGDKIPIELTMVFADGQWKVFGLSGARAGIAISTPDKPETPVASTTPASPGTPSVQLPSDEEMRSLVFDALFNLQQSMRKKDFNLFYGFISPQWQKETSADALKKQYQELIDKKYERAVFIGTRPVFESGPSLNFDDSVTVIGYYATKPLKVAFELRYSLEDSAWKLRRADIKLTEDTSGIGPLPGPAELNRLVTSTLLALNEAITKKDFQPFYQSISKRWQQNTSPEKLQTNFEPFIENKLDMKSIADVDPVFSDKPILNMENQFSVSGRYEAKDLKLEFTISFQFENSAWKAINIHLGAETIPTDTQPEKSQ